jgi:hypothetical protein
LFVSREAEMSMGAATLMLILRISCESLASRANLLI